MNAFCFNSKLLRSRGVALQSDPKIEIELGVTQRDQSSGGVLVCMVIMFYFLTFWPIYEKC